MRKINSFELTSGCLSIRIKRSIKEAINAMPGLIRSPDSRISEIKRIRNDFSNDILRLIINDIINFNNILSHLYACSWPDKPCRISGIDRISFIYAFQNNRSARNNTSVTNLGPVKDH